LVADLFAKSMAVEQLGVPFEAQRFRLSNKPAEQILEGWLACDLDRDRVRRVRLVFGNLNGDLSARFHLTQQPRHQPLVVRHPLKRSVRENEVEIPKDGELRDIAPTKANSLGRPLARLLEHRVRRV